MVDTGMTHTTDTGAQEARIKLKPCKSCGGAPEVTYYGLYFGEWDNDLELTDDMLDDIDDIHCAECGLWTGEDMTLREAIKWWNNQPLIEELQATIATQAARIAELERKNNELMGIGTPYPDGFSEQELERYAQTSPPEMFRNYLNLQADNERLRGELASRQVPDGEVSVPVEMIRICTSYGMPLGITYAEYNAARDKVLAWLNTLKGNE